jgi:hypothetical protein
MSLITIFLIVVGIILVLFILNNYMITECFQDINPENIRKNAYKHIESIKDNYEKLKVFYKNEKADINGILEAKKYIKDAINNIDILLLNSYDRYKLSDIYHNELIPILDKPKDLIFFDIIEKIKIIIDNSINNNYYNHRNTIKEIRSNFKQLNEIYKNVYIDKVFTYIEKRDLIDSLIKTIYDLLLKITDYDDLNSSGIIIILNTSLSRAYETNNVIEINSNINSFEEKIKRLAIKLNVDEEKKDFDVIPANTGDMNINASVDIISPKVNISVTTIKNDFNNIYNSFDLINKIYSNNKELNNNQQTQIKSLNNIIYNSINNIANYDKNNKNYYNNVTVINNVIIKPILEAELLNAYKLNDDNKIIRVKNRFYDAIIEIKNLIITNYSKTSISTDKNKCLKEIIDAIINNNFPIKVNELKNCDKSLFNNNNLVIYPKLAISKNGKKWDFATDLYELKKTGINNNPYIYSYKLAGTTNDGKDWKFISPSVGN